MKGVKLIMILIFASVIFSSCKKNKIWVYYNETSCSDTWGNAKILDHEKTENVKRHLKSKGISVFQVKITFDGIVDTCKSCYCKTGKRIGCEIDETDLYKAINENFYK